MDNNMNLIEKTFTYDLPDDYLYQTNDLKKTGTWTYKGPDKIWVMISKDDNKFKGWHLDESNDGETYPTPLDMYKVFIDCEKEPLLATLFGPGHHYDYGSLEHSEEVLPDGTIYSRPETPPPDHTYEVREIVYDPDTNTFVKPYPWKVPHSDWTLIRTWRNDLLQSSDYRVGDHMPKEVAAKWEEWRQTLRDIPQSHGAVNVKTSLDLTANAPVNTIGQNIIDR